MNKTFTYLLSICCFLLVSCGANNNVNKQTLFYTVGGTVSGLKSGEFLVITNNKYNGMEISQNGQFTFTKAVAANNDYSVQIVTQPTGEFCTINNGFGVDISVNIANIQIRCSEVSYSVSVTVAGLATGQKLTLVNNITNALTINGNGAYTFSLQIAKDSNYNVTVLTQPNNEICTVNNGSGAGVIANVNDISVLCSNDNYSIGGNIVGLDSDQQVTIMNNGDIKHALTLTTNAPFTFIPQVTFDSSYSITVLTQPNNEICTINNGSEAGVVANVNNVIVSCSNDSYSIGGTIVGLSNGQQVTIANNRDIAHALTLTADSAFTFVPQVTFNGSYNVTIIAQPNNEVCTVNRGWGTGVVANVNNITVSCRNDSYDISGKVLGLESGQQVTIKNNGDTANAIILTSNTTFTFTPQIVFGANYNVTISTQPLDSKCSVTNGSGIVSGNVSSVLISCSAIPGALIPLGSIATGIEPQGMAITPNGKYVYVANNADNSLSMYRIDKNGKLVVLNVPTISNEDNPIKIVVTPDGNHLYVTNSNFISMYGIESNGELVALAPATISNKHLPNTIVVTPNGKYVYTLNSNRTLSMYKVGANGELAILNPAIISTGKSPSDMAVTPNGNYLYVTNSEDNTLSMYSIGDDGELSKLTPATIPTSGNSPAGIVVAPNGKYAYVANLNDQTLSMYSVAGNGNLDTSSTPAIATEIAPRSIAITPNGDYTYVTNFGENSLSMYNVYNNGELSPLYVSANNNVIDTESSPYAIVVTPNGKYLYITNETSNTVSEYLIQN